jgi:putative SOS response-associated peptidase YedK
VKNGDKMMRWGLLPHWAKDESFLFDLNARSEDSPPSLRSTMRGNEATLSGRTDGLHEWKTVKEKQPQDHKSHFLSPFLQR